MDDRRTESLYEPPKYYACRSMNHAQSYVWHDRTQEYHERTGDIGAASALDETLRRMWRD